MFAALRAYRSSFVTMYISTWKQMVISAKVQLPKHHSIQPSILWMTGLYIADDRSADDIHVQPESAR